MRDEKWVRLLAYVTGLVNQRLLLQNEYLMAENRILRAHLPNRLRLSDPQRSTLAEIGKRLGRKALAEVTVVARPETILAWYRRLVAQKFDGSKHRKSLGRPPIPGEIVGLIVQMAKENPSWGYDRIAGALSNLGHCVSDQTVGNILRRHGIAPAPKRSQTTTWKDFIAAHMAVLAGIDFFTVEVLTWRGLATYYVLFFIQLESRRVDLAGVTRHPDALWMEQMARNAIDLDIGHLRNQRYVLHDRDTKYCATFRSILESGGVKCLALPARSPNLNAFAERWVGSVKQECLRKLILFGEASLRRALSAYTTHYHSERNHQAKGNHLLFPEHKSGENPLHSVRRVLRLGGLLSYYTRAA
jgi:transposase InsO family protein